MTARHQRSAICQQALKPWPDAQERDIRAARSLPAPAANLLPVPAFATAEWRATWPGSPPLLTAVDYPHWHASAPAAPPDRSGIPPAPARPHRRTGSHRAGPVAASMHSLGGTADKPRCARQSIFTVTPIRGVLSVITSSCIEHTARTLADADQRPKSDFCAQKRTVRSRPSSSHSPQFRAECPHWVES